jgi:hypothetical protein
MSNTEVTLEEYAAKASTDSRTLDEKKKRAAEIIGLANGEPAKINWHEEDRGILECPGVHLHTKKTEDKHTILYLDSVPTLYCFHNSCGEVIEDTNKVLRQELCDQTPEERTDSKLKYRAKADVSSDARKVLKAKDWVMKNYRWDELLYNPYDPQKSFEIFLRVWRPEDIIWVGEVWSTGPVKGPGHFDTVERWGNRPPNFYVNHFTTVSTYQPGTFDRVQKQVVTTPYLTIEFDSLSPDKDENRLQGAAMLNYLRSIFDPVFIVDSGNKSLHMWVKNNEKVTEERKHFLRMLGADTKTMRPAQAVRVPGGRRENGRVQHLLWINPTDEAVCNHGALQRSNNNNNGVSK